MSGPRKIVLVGNFQPDRQQSMLRFETALTSGFRALDLDVETVRPEPRFVKCLPSYRYGGLPKYLGYLDKFLLFPRRLRRLARTHPPDTVFHITDHSNAMYAGHLPAGRVIVTVHDLLQIRSALGEIPQNPIGRSGQRYQAWVLQSLARLQLAACVSQKTRGDLLRLARVPEQAAVVVPMALNYPYRPLPALEAAPLLASALARQQLRWPAACGPIRNHETNTPSPFLFGIGGGQWYKNRTGLIATFAALRRLPGQTRALLYVGPPFDPEQETLIAQNRLQDAILRIPDLHNEELRAAYSLADGLLFPSWEEGFGWPIAEAQACGCPVFTSNRAPMTEVGGNAAAYFDPANPVAAAGLIADTLRNPAPLRDAGLTYAKRWDPQAMLDAYWHLYTLLLRSPAPAPAPSAA
jgi:glycosyltransferase involved in cell wall biosynthesis